MAQRACPLLLLAALLTGVSVAANGQQDRIPLQPIAVDQTHRFSVGEFDSAITLKGTLTPTLRPNGDRVLVELLYSEPGLYDKLIKALTPRSGCRRIYAGGASEEVALCSLNRLSATFNEDKRHIRIRARVKLRKSLAGVQIDESNHDASLEIRTEGRGDHIALTPESLNIEKVPGEIDRILKKQIPAATLPLEGCLTNSGLHLEDVEYGQGSEEVRAVGSIPQEKWQDISWCLLEQEFGSGVRSGS